MTKKKKSKFKEIFYTLPARCLEEGMSTDDGQDILEVSVGEEDVLYYVYTPRPDNYALDAENRDAGETRGRPRDALVSLAVFEDTLVDGSKHKEAVLQS